MAKTYRDQPTTEMSLDGGNTWEVVQLPQNCHPYDQVRKFGRYEETTDKGVALYRRGT